MDDDGGEPARPAPWRSPAARARAATLGRLRPWLDWFGAGRLAGAALTVLVAVGAGWWLLRPSRPPTETTLPYASAVTSPEPSPSPSPTTTVDAPPVVVHVAGAVAAPGVYELRAGARVVDAVAAAGGALVEADVGVLNLAVVVADGQRVYVPRVGEPVPPDVGPAPAPGSSVPAGPVDLNAATAAELDRLPGIGPTTAQAIVDHRDANGPFVTVDDLEAVRGIGPAKLEAIRDQVTT